MTQGSDAQRIAVRHVLRETAALVNGSGPLDAILDAVTDRLILAAHATEVCIAVGAPSAWRIRWRRTAAGFSLADDPVADPLACAVLVGGASMVRHRYAYSALHDDGRTIGALWIVSSEHDYDDDALALCDAFAGYVSLALQKAALHDRAKHLEELVVVDALTGVANRRAFDAAIDREWQACLRDGTGLALIMLDVDWFKAYNDRYGHQLGDEVLKEIAACLRDQCSRPRDVVARYGGEEFVALLPSTTLEGARHLAEGVRRDVVSRNIAHDGSALAVVTVSLGVAEMMPTGELSPSDLIQSADVLLYQAKRSGRNTVASREDRPALARDQA